MLSNRFLWPGMIGIALAVGIGVQMGESAIGAINPIHFQGAAAPVQGIDPNSLPPPPQSTYAQAYGWEQGYAARQAESGVGDFDYVPQASVQRASVQRAAAAPVWMNQAPAATLAPWPPGRISSHPEVERYMDYPIEEKRADPGPAPDPAPAPVPDAPEDKAQPPQ
jgi:hypothetical protein